MKRLQRIFQLTLLLLVLPCLESQEGKQENTASTTLSAEEQGNGTSTTLPTDEDVFHPYQIVVITTLSAIFTLIPVSLAFVCLWKRKKSRIHAQTDDSTKMGRDTTNTTDIERNINELPAPKKGSKCSANIHLGESSSKKRKISSTCTRSMISSETCTSEGRIDEVGQCVKLGAAANVVSDMSILSSPIGDKTEKEDRESLHASYNYMTTPKLMNTTEDGYTRNLALAVPIATDRSCFTSQKFKEAIFCHKGGHLTLENYGISLFVPPGAIEKGVNQAVSIELTYDKKHMPDLLGGEAVISPVVICRPKGLIFKESVVLRYPHCGGGQHKIKHLTSDTDHMAPVYYRNSTAEDKNSIGLVMGDMCLRLIDHFTLYTTVSEGPVIKAFMIFADFRDLQNKDVVILRIWIVNNTKDAVEEVLSHESRKRGTELFGPKPYTIDSTAGDVQIEFKKMTDRWSVPDTMKIPLKSTLTYVVNHEQIVIKRIDGSLMHCDRVSMEVCIYQLRNANAEKVKVAISEKIPQGSQAGKGPTSPKSDTCPSEPIPAALPFGLCQNICLLMDSKHPTGNDWRMLAEKVGLDMPAIQVLEENKAENSPTGKLLSIWQSERSGIKMKHFRELRDLFVNIHRDDVATVISEFIKVYEKNGLEAADQAIAPSSNSQKVLAYIEYNHTKKPIMQAQGEDQSKDNITQSRSQLHSNDKLTGDDDESLENSAQVRKEKNCRQLQSQDSFPEEKSALKSSKEAGNEENASGLYRNNDVESAGLGVIKRDSGFYSEPN